MKCKILLNCKVLKHLEKNGVTTKEIQISKEENYKIYRRKEMTQDHFNQEVITIQEVDLVDRETIEETTHLIEEEEDSREMEIEETIETMEEETIREDDI